MTTHFGTTRSQSMRKVSIYIPSRHLSLATAKDGDVGRAVNDLTFICEGATFIKAQGVWYGNEPYERVDEDITVGIWLYHPLTPIARVTAIHAAIDKIVDALHVAGETSVLVESSDVAADFR